MIDFEKAKPFPYVDPKAPDMQETYFDDYYQFFSNFMTYDRYGAHAPDPDTIAYQNMAIIQRFLKRKFKRSEYADKNRYLCMHIHF